MTRTLITTIMVLAAVSAAAGAPPPDDMVKALSDTIRKKCPDAKIETTKDAFVAKHGTMMFTLHSRAKSGEISSQTYQQEGPNFKGFILRVALEDGKYGGAAEVPQTLQGSYFPTFIDAPATDDGKKHYQVHFSYGSRLDPELKKAIFDVIPKTRFQQLSGGDGKCVREQPGLDDEGAHKELLNRLKEKMPQDWAVAAIERGKVNLWYWNPSEGNGTRISLLPRKALENKDDKAGKPGGLIIWLMDATYTARQPGPSEDRQTLPPRELTKWRNRRVMVWGAVESEWPRWKSDLLAALAASDSPSTQAELGQASEPKRPMVSLAVLAEQPPVIISGRTEKPEYEVGQRTSHGLTIANRSSKPVTRPSFRFLNIKQEDAEIAFYVQQHVLEIQVTRGKDPVAVNKDWQAPAKEARPFPTVELPPGQSISAGFSLTRRWYPSFFSLTEPGEYNVTVTLDTTKLADEKILKGRFSSAPVAFRIVPVATFREKNTGESPVDYANAKVAFYLDRIAQQKGEYFPNVGNLLRTPEAIPVLIEILGSKDAARAQQAGVLLGQVHHRCGNPHPPVLPESKDAWRKWWETKGAKLPVPTLWSNFDSFYQ